MKRILDDLRHSKVLVLHPRDEDGAALVDHLKRLGCEAKALWPPPPTLPRDVDVIFVQVEDTSIESLVPLMEGSTAAIVAIATYESPTLLKAIADINAHGVITKPLRQVGVLTQFALAKFRASYEARLSNKVRKLEETLKGRRAIEKAVKILTAVNGADEDAAYKMIRDQATAKRVAIVSVAESIIAANEAMRAFGLKPMNKPDAV